MMELKNMPKMQKDLRMMFHSQLDNHLHHGLQVKLKMKKINTEEVER